MNISTPRLILYALISSIEEDMRDLIIHQISPNREINILFAQDELQKAILRRKKNSEITDDVVDDNELFDFLDFSDAFQIINRFSSDLTKSQAKYFKRNAKNLEKLSQVRNRVMHSRPLVFDDLPDVTDFSNRAIRELPDIWVKLSNTVENLKSPGYLHELDVRFDDVVDKVSHNLPLPDFDDTGYIGREEDIERIQKAIKGPYPVITILGEGGIGKTAIILKIAYDLIDDPNCDFDAIVWSSAKRNILTSTEIREIHTNINNSLDLFREASQKGLNESGSQNPTADLKEYMEEFNILLILDNLETVLDSKLRDFVQEIPAGKSKILITSRIGLGAYEFPINLPPLSEKEASQYFRSLIRAYNLSDFRRHPSHEVKRYCKKLKYNPLFIKWFVRAVKSGIRPEVAINNQGLALEYCLGNVYQHLDENSKSILEIFLVLTKNLTLAVLSYISTYEIHEIENVLSKLLTFGLIDMVKDNPEINDVTSYKLTVLARGYLSQFHPPSNDRQQIIQTKYNQLISSQEEIQYSGVTDKYDINHLNISTTDGIVIAKYLKEALKASRSRAFDVASDLINKAKSIGPNNPEVHRVSALIHAFEGNNIQANDEYLNAIDIKPEWAPYRYFYGQFLFKNLNDYDGAMEQYKKGVELETKPSRFLMRIAFMSIIKNDFQDAQKLIDQVMSMDLPARVTRMVYGLQINLFQRKAEFQARNGDYNSSYAELKNIGEICKSINRHHIDKQTRKHINKSLRTAKICHFKLDDIEVKNDVNNYIIWARNFTGESNAPEPEDKDIFGVVVTLKLEKKFGFIQSETGNSYYFHNSEVLDPMSWTEGFVSKNVIFDTLPAKKGPMAINIRLLE